MLKFSHFVAYASIAAVHFAEAGHLIGESTESWALVYIYFTIALLVVASRH